MADLDHRSYSEAAHHGDFDFEWNKLGRRRAHQDARQLFCLLDLGVHNCKQIEGLQKMVLLEYSLLSELNVNHQSLAARDHFMQANLWEFEPLLFPLLKENITFLFYNIAIIRNYLIVQQGKTLRIRHCG